MRATYKVFAKDQPDESSSQAASQLQGTLKETCLCETHSRDERSGEDPYPCLPLTTLDEPRATGYPMRLLALATLVILKLDSSKYNEIF